MTESYLFKGFTTKAVRNYDRKYLASLTETVDGAKDLLARNLPQRWEFHMTPLSSEYKFLHSVFDKVHQLDTQSSPVLWRVFSEIYFGTLTKKHMLSLSDTHIREKKTCYSP